MRKRPQPREVLPVRRPAPSPPLTPVDARRAGATPRAGVRGGGVVLIEGSVQRVHAGRVRADTATIPTGGGRPPPLVPLPFYAHRQEKRVKSAALPAGPRRPPKHTPNLLFSPRPPQRPRPAGARRRHSPRQLLA